MGIFHQNTSRNEQTKIFETTVDGRNPKQPPGMYKNLVNNGLFTISTGAGFQPSSVPPIVYLLNFAILWGKGWFFWSTTCSPSTFSFPMTRLAAIAYSWFSCYLEIPSKGNKGVTWLGRLPYLHIIINTYTYIYTVYIYITKVFIYIHIYTHTPIIVYIHSRH